jgi:hypothetical protein
VARSRKKLDYLDALNDPNLAVDRRLALRFLQTVRLEQAFGDALPPLIDPETEEARLKTVFECANCGEPTDGLLLFCDDLCKQIPQTIRYIRKAISDGRIEKPDAQEGAGRKLLMLTGGGYPERERRLTTQQRQTILKRDNHTCQLCGKPGDQVDHIAGDSGDPSNLRALCGACNLKEAFKNFQPITDSAKADDLNAMLSNVAQRIGALIPTELCDDHERWDNCCMGIVGARRRLSNSLARQKGVFPELRHTTAERFPAR